MYRLRLKKGSILKVNGFKGVNFEFHGDKEYPQEVLKNLHENGLKLVEFVEDEKQKKEKK